MQATELMRRMLVFLDKFAMPCFEDMRDAALTQPTSHGGNHPHWLIGHLAMAEGGITGMVTGEPNVNDDLKDHFGQGTEPSKTGAGYPSYDELLERYRAARARTHALLEKLSDEDLDKPPRACPAEMLEWFPTVGDALMLVGLHQEFHMGQLADARRAAGRKPLFG